MTPLFAKLYSEHTTHNRSETQDITKQTLYQGNPNKVRALMYLLEHHEKLNDQIIVFCDSVALITYLASHLKKPLLGGSTDN
jgi:superfamily II DNA/RNA helicase